MQRLIASLLLISTLLAAPITCVRQAAAANMQIFRTEAAAQKYCPKDIVVWLNPRNRTYYFKGQLWHGNTVTGGYVCEKEAAQAGYRASRNGQ